jgi:hypothetical protein
MYLSINLEEDIDNYLSLLEGPVVRAKDGDGDR